MSDQPTKLHVLQSRIPNSGQGVFLKQGCRPITVGTIVGEYTGILYDDSDDLTDTESVYAFQLPNNKTLVGTGTLSRVNDIMDFRQLSPKETFDLDRLKKLPIVPHLQYNVEWHTITDRKKGRPTIHNVYMRAIKQINPGDELYISYGYQYWEYRYKDAGFLTEY